MNKRTIKLGLTGICMLAAGICYSCGRDVPAQSKDEIPYIETVWAEKADGGAAVNGGAPDGETAGDGVSGGTAAGGGAANSAASGPAAKLCYVHVCGEVMNPGVYEMEAGSRVFQALEKAGGFTQEASDEYLNMAEIIQDGMKLQVPSKQEVEAGTVPKPSIAGGAGQPAKVNINIAGKEQLMTLRGVGESRAEDIIRYREEHGSFGSIEEIMEVSGIKDAAFQKIKEDITV